MDGFYKFHPLINLIYFLSVILFAMFLKHPAALIISLFASIFYAGILVGRKALFSSLLFVLPVMVFSAVLNPLFNHEGVTILTYLKSGNPLTMESIVYGIYASAVIADVIYWFICFNKIITTDKIVYLFGKIMPSLSILISVSVRFVPRFVRQFKDTINAQKCMGRDISKTGLKNKLKAATDVTSQMITHSLETAVETSDSMKSRGYGTFNRTSYSIFKFRKKDFVLLAAMLLFIVYTLVGIILKSMYFEYFPYVKSCNFTAYSVSVFASYLLLCATPLIINVWEAVRWKLLKSKI